MTADEAAGDGSIFYCVSTDDRSTWKIAHNTDGIRSIVRNNSGTWQYNSNGTYGSETSIQLRFFVFSKNFNLQNLYELREITTQIKTR